jgi:hypothetical protein
MRIERFLDELVPAEWLDFEWQNITAPGDRTLRFVRGGRHATDRAKAEAARRMLELRAEHPTAFEGTRPGE